MADHGSDHGHHIIPLSTLLKVFGALVFLTLLTVATGRYVNLGVLDIPLALAIASTKATLVVAVFMALKYDKRVNALMFIVGILFVMVFLGFTLLDTVFRGDVGNISGQTVGEIERQEELLREREPDPEALQVAPGGPNSDATEEPEEETESEPEADLD